jgi:hypothetical protein
MKMPLGELHDAAEMQAVEEHKSTGSPDVVRDVIARQALVEQLPAGVLAQGENRFRRSAAVHPHLVDEDTVGGVSVTLSGPEIAVPPSLAAILTRLPVSGPFPRTRPLIGGDTLGWLFPGSAATGHLNAATMSKRLKAHGIPTRQARNAALIAMAGELPISLVSDLFGISISTAINWARRAGKDWNAYLAASHGGVRRRHHPAESK